MRNSRKSTDGNHAFTLVELLAVIGIMVALMAMAVPAFTSVSRSSSLSSAANTIVDQFSMARQAATAQSSVVEVRFYQDATATSGASPYYRSFRIYGVGPTGISSPITNKAQMPAGVIMDSDPNYSSILGPSRPSYKETGPGGATVNYKAVQFRPDGSTDLDPGGPAQTGAVKNTNDTWYVSIRAEYDKTVKGQPAANFVTVQVDALNGRVTVFRP